MIFEALPAAGPLHGTVRVPGDKSISHRAVLFAAMAEGTSELAGVLDSEDVRSTIGAVRALGATVEETGTDTCAGLRLRVTGWGAAGPRTPSGPIDCGNSGTAARLLLGVIAGYPVTATLTGDSSLSRRPMLRVTEPLERMGALFETTGGHLPVRVVGGELRAIEFDMTVASAQVKTAVLLAALRAQGTTTVTEPVRSRDHTERMLPGFGVPVAVDAAARTVSVVGPALLHAVDVEVPADASSAAFIAGAAALVPGSDVEVRDVDLNPTRTGFIRVMQRMGAGVEVTRLSAADGDAEPYGTLRVRYRRGLRATTVSPGEVPSLVDEVPLLAVIATAAAGTTRFEGVSELRVKESDRLQAVADGLAALGAEVRSGSDWLEIDGPTRLRAAGLTSLGDHRLAMSWAVAALAADGPVDITGWEAVAVSYPRFAEDVASLR